MTGTPDVSDNAGLLPASASLPGHVVYRAFVAETVVLNLQTGKYHGLNPSGGRMLAIVERAATIQAAAKLLAGEYGRPVEEMESDLCDFCRDLLDRGLIEISYA